MLTALFGLCFFALSHSKAVVDGTLYEFYTQSGTRGVNLAAQDTGLSIRGAPPGIPSGVYDLKKLDTSSASCGWTGASCPSSVQIVFVVDSRLLQASWPTWRTLIGTVLTRLSAGNSGSRFGVAFTNANAATVFLKSQLDTAAAVSSLLSSFSFASTATPSLFARACKESIETFFGSAPPVGVQRYLVVLMADTESIDVSYPWSAVNSLRSSITTFAMRKRSAHQSNPSATLNVAIDDAHIILKPSESSFGSEAELLWRRLCPSGVSTSRLCISCPCAANQICPSAPSW